MFGPKVYNRSRVYQDAETARGKGKKARAIAGYRTILEHEPDDFQVHGKLAPLLADDAPHEAWASFEKAAKGHLDKGFSDRALAVYRQAADLLPFIADGWTQVAALHQLKGRRADAVRTLMDGQAHFWGTEGQREVALRFIQQALELEPLHLDATLALARALKLRGDAGSALAHLNALLERHPSGPSRKLLLRARLGVAFSLRHLWSWLRGR